MQPIITPRSFTADFLASLARTPEDVALLAQAFHVQPEQVHKTDAVLDMQGVDYTIQTPDGSRTCDVKRRSKGAAKYWRDVQDPELAVELKTGGRLGPLFRPGAEFTLPDVWALLYDDQPGKVYLVPARQLAMAAKRNLPTWLARFRRFKSRTLTERGSYVETEVLYVSLSAVSAAITALERM